MTTSCRTVAAVYAPALAGLLGSLLFATACAPPAPEAPSTSRALSAPATTTLEGTVLSGNAPLNATRVEALPEGTSSVAASTTTDAAGAFSLSLTAGSYDLRVTA